MRGRQTDRDGESETDRQTDRERQADRQTDRDSERDPRWYFMTDNLSRDKSANSNGGRP